MASDFFFVWGRGIPEERGASVGSPVQNAHFVGHSRKLVACTSQLE